MTNKNLRDADLGGAGFRAAYLTNVDDVLGGEYRGFNIALDLYAPNGFLWAHKNFDGPEDTRRGQCATVAECKAEIDAWWDERTIYALRGLVGLFEILESRADVTSELKALIEGNHRMVEAREVLVGQMAAWHDPRTSPPHIAAIIAKAEGRDA